MNRTFIVEETMLPNTSNSNNITNECAYTSSRYIIFFKASLTITCKSGYYRKKFAFEAQVGEKVTKPYTFYQTMCVKIGGSQTYEWILHNYRAHLDR